MSHFVVRSAELEAEDGEEILPLEKDAAFEAVTEVHCVRKGGLVDDIVNP